MWPFDLPADDKKMVLYEHESEEDGEKKLSGII